MQLVTWQISGLGNQLFQYAAGRYYAQRYGAPMRMAVAPYKKAHSYGSPRPFLLSHFNIEAPAAEASGADRFFLSTRSNIRPFIQTARAALGIQVFQEQPAQRYRFLENLPIHKGTRTLYLVGYWQAHQIVDAVEDQLRKEFTFKAPATGKTLEILKSIQDSSCPVSLHVRRGDYTLAAEGNVALPLSYYERAIDIIREREQNPTFFVFSDDMEFVRENLPRSARMVFVDHNDDYSSHEDLRLMSHCRHHIIANSTFSWWGAWLNSNAEKIVVAPRQWLLKKETYFPQLMPTEWILLDVAAER